jgi:hypothetical protein
MLFRSKTAMSPLIATVLLIAFAVALGAMIMNWSAGIESGESGMVAGCDDISLTTTKNICYSDNALKITLKNNGAERVSAVSIHLTNIAEDLDMTMRVKDSTIIPGETIERSLPILHPGDDVEIEVTPMVLVDGDLVSCDDKGFIQQKLVNC